MDPISLLLNNTAVPQPFRNMMAMPYPVGLFVIEWAKLEFGCIALVKSTGSYDFETLKRKMLQDADYMRKSLKRALVQIHHPKTADIMKRFADISVDRNDIIHGLYNQIDDQGVYIVKRTPRKAGEDSYIVRMTPEYVSDCHRRLSALCIEIFQIEVLPGENGHAPVSREFST